MSLKASGTQTATLTTEHTLATVTPTLVGEALQLSVDINALVDTEVVTLKIKTKVLSAGTSRITYKESFTAMQGAIQPVIVLPPMLFDQDAVFTLEQNNGTGRAFPWKVLSP